jgi:sialate O-acetylesterase
MTNFKHIFIAIILILTSFQINAKIKLPALFSDNMMLQQKSNAPMWGWAEKNANLTIKTSWNAKIYKAKADNLGKWNVALLTTAAGGPFTIEVTE